MSSSQNWGYPFGGPFKKDYSILGPILGPPYFGKLPFRVFGKTRALLKMQWIRTNDDIHACMHMLSLRRRHSVAIWPIMRGL